MAIESLSSKLPSNFSHDVRHDLESLFYVIIALCTYTTKPGLLRDHIPDAFESSVCLNEWWNQAHSRRQLARIKASMVSAISLNITSRFPAYWNDFHCVIEGLQKALWPDGGYVELSTNQATHDKFLDVLTKARDHFSQEPEAASPLEYAHMSTNKKVKVTRTKSNTGNDQFQPVIITASHKRKNIDSDVDDDGAVRGQKSARAKGRTRFLLPHNINQQAFGEYIDSGLPSVHK